MELVSNCQFGVSFYDAQLALSVLASIVKIYQTQRAVFDHIFKHFEVRQKYSAPRRIFNSPLVVKNVIKHGISCLRYYMYVANYYW